MYDKNYSQIERVGLAVVLGVPHFQKFLFGRHFTILTNYQLFERMFGGKLSLSATAVANVNQ